MGSHRGSTPPHTSGGRRLGQGSAKVSRGGGGRPRRGRRRGRRAARPRPRRPRRACARSRARARSRRRRSGAPEAVERARRCSARHARTLVAHVELDPRRRRGGAVTVMVASAARPRARSRAGCRAPARSGRGSRAHGLRRRRARRQLDVALVGERAATRRARSPTTAAGSIGCGGAGPRVGAREREQGVDERAEPLDLGSAPSRSRLPVGATSRSRFSSRRRSAASGVRSWCEASATKSCWERSERLELRPWSR